MTIKLSPLQQELFDYLVDELDDGSGTVRQEDGTALARDISTMNAAQLRHNLKVFKEVDNTLESLARVEKRRNMR